MSLRKEAFLSFLTIVLIFAATMVILLTDLEKFGVAQAQSNITSSLTPQQKAAMCDPNNPKLNFVNTTESHICGIPMTVKSSPANASSLSNTTTTGGQPPPTDLAPSAAPP